MQVQFEDALVQRMLRFIIMIPMLPIEEEPDPKPYKVFRCTSDRKLIEPPVAQYATAAETNKHPWRGDWHYTIFLGRKELGPPPI